MRLKELFIIVLILILCLIFESCISIAGEFVGDAITYRANICNDNFTITKNLGSAGESWGMLGDLIYAIQLSIQSGGLQYRNKSVFASCIVWYFT